jgi:hypothetical protein
MVGDASAFAGVTAELTIQCAGNPGAIGTLSENVFDLDAISFSPSPVPEPTSCEAMLLFVGFCLLGGRR